MFFKRSQAASETSGMQRIFGPQNQARLQHISQGEAMDLSNKDALKHYREEGWKDIQRSPPPSKIMHRTNPSKHKCVKKHIFVCVGSNAWVLEEELEMVI